MNLSRNIIKNIRYMLAHGHNQLLDELYLPNTVLYGRKMYVGDVLPTILEDVIYVIHVEGDKRILEIPGGIYTNEEIEYIVSKIDEPEKELFKVNDGVLVVTV